MGLWLWFKYRQCHQLTKKPKPIADTLPWSAAEGYKPLTRARQFPLVSKTSSKVSKADETRKKGKMSKKKKKDPKFGTGKLLLLFFYLLQP